MRYEIVSNDCFTELLSLPENYQARRFMLTQFGRPEFWYDPVWDASTPPVHVKTMVYLDGTRLLGFFRYAVSHNRMLARGTWVRKCERRKGLGSSLWQQAINSYRHGSLHLDVSTTSQGGDRLVRSLLPKFKHARHWSTYGDGDFK